MAVAILISPVPGFMNAVADVCGYSNATRSGFRNHQITRFFNPKLWISLLQIISCAGLNPEGMALL